MLKLGSSLIFFIPGIVALYRSRYKVFRETLDTDFDDFMGILFKRLSIVLPYFRGGSRAKRMC